MGAAHGPSVDLGAELLSLPKFVDGGIRCGVLEEERGRAKGAGDGRLGVRRLLPPDLRVLGVQEQKSKEQVPCSAPGPWCVVFGPSETDHDAHKLRKEVDELRAWQEERAAVLRQRVEKAEASALRERKLRLEVLRRLQGGRQSVYLGNDDSMSLASPQRLIWAIDHGQPLPVALVRPHELLNYFSFETLPTSPGEVFSVLPELSPHPARNTDLTLALSVRGRQIERLSRRPLNLTYVIDRSGSMGAPGRLDFIKKGLVRSLRELKPGDLMQIVLFDSVTCPLVQNFVVGRDSLGRLTQLISAIEPRDGSNLSDGLAQGYAAASRAYRDQASNRVVLMTDAELTSILDDEDIVALSVNQYDARRVRLSAVGVGPNSGDRLLDRLTEAGRGASVFLSSEQEVEAVFGARFTSLVETVASDVHFKLELPPAIRLRAFYGEESSMRREKVRAVHYFSGTEQMYLANLEKVEALRPTDHVRLTIEYEDPDSGQRRASDFSWRADELEMATGSQSEFQTRNLNKARMVATFGYQLGHMAETYGHLLTQAPEPTWTAVRESDVEEPRAPSGDERILAVTHCRRVKGRLDAFSAELGGEKEARRITELWHRYCERFEKLAAPELLARLGVGPMDARTKKKLVELGRPAVFKQLIDRANDFAPEEEVF